MDKYQKKQVLVALSGGVDSSVAAALLKKQGYKITGFYLRLFRDEKKEKQIKKIAKAIGMPLIIKDAQKEFRKKVIDYFLREYKEGRTPNPCVVCNREIKFKFLFEELNKLKADYVATGHYARIANSTSPAPPRQDHPSLIKEGMGEVFYKLFSAKDKTKDQSYFLYTLTQKQLSKILFPLGDYKKEEVKKIARNLKLPVNEEESRNVCFIAGKCPDEFLKKNIKMKSGNITDINGNIIGRHIGLPLYTIGQRRNIRIGGTGPYYVAAKDFRKNELIVVKKSNNPLLYRKELLLGSSTPTWELSSQVNWILGKPKFPLQARVCIRYHHPAVRAIIEEVRGGKCEVRGYKIKFTKPQRAVTPGQAAVIYSEKGEVLGGGTIS